MRCPDLSELPAPPVGRTGWPWTEQSPRLPDSMADGRLWPRISITTPSFNQGAFLEETIRSVLLQGYPDLEYSVFDGGSTDQSEEVIRKYERWLTHWQSQPDRGQSHAINQGWSLISGDLVSWLCSDDVLLPSCLGTVARAWDWDPQVAMITGGVQATNADSHVTGQRLSELPYPSPLDLSVIDHESLCLPQPSSFYARVALDQAGRWLREDLKYTMDREILYRLCRTGSVILVPVPIATYREHSASKTVSASLAQLQEAPKALAYCNWGNAEAEAARRRVGRWRIAKGHYLFAVSAPSPRESVGHYLRAVRLRPSYLDPRRRGVWRIVLRALGLLGPSRAVRDLLTSPPPSRSTDLRRAIQRDDPT